MTGLIAVFDREGMGPDPRLVERLLAAVGERGGDQHVAHFAGPCSLGIAEHRTTPEDGVRPQPAIDASSGVCVVLDGRLDDRESLVRSLPGVDAADLLAASDAQLVLAAYLAFGSGCAVRLFGDFAIVVWDPQTSQVLCIRDVCGIRPLYYAVTQRWLVVGSSLKSILMHPAIPRRANQGMIGEYLAFGLCSQEETLYEAVRRLPPAHLMRAGRTHLRIERYWDLNPERRIRYPDPREYEEHFRECFSAAVSDRLRCNGPLGVTLSGGFDSSAVAGVAQQLLLTSGNSRRLRAYSLTYPEEACDETPYIEAVVERWRLPARRFPWQDFGACPWVDEPRTSLDIPEYPFATAYAGLYAAARADGVRVLLTGEGGDFWQGGSTLPYRQLLLDGQFGALVRDLRHVIERQGLYQALRLVTASLMWGFVPGAGRRLIEGWRRGLPLPPYLAPQFVREHGLWQRLRCGDCAERFPDASQWQIVKRARSGILVHFYEMIERSAVRRGIEQRHPLFDRRLIELALAVPDYVRRCRGRDRALMRDSLADIYPPAVRGRRDAATFGMVLVRALAVPQVRQILDSKRLLERPWLLPDRYREFRDRTYARMAENRLNGPLTMYFLWMLFAIECWCRRADGPET